MNRTSAQLAGLAVLLLVGIPALANDEPDELIPGKVILVKSGRQAKVVSKLAPGQDFKLPSAANDPTVEGATLTFFDTASGGNEVTYDLNASGWRALGNPPGSRGFKYRGRDATPEDDVCRSVTLKTKVLKAVCRGDEVGVPLTTPFNGDAAVILTMGTDSKRYCMVFGGTVRRNDVKLLKRTGATAPGTCVDVGPAATATATYTPTAASTETPTVTSTPTATATLGTEIGNHLCALGAGSVFELNLEPPFPIPFALDGAAVDVSCGTVDGGSLEAPCSCAITSDIEAVSPLGFLCLEAVAGCDDGKVDCNGGDAFGLNINADHHLATCTDNPDCATQCATQCGALEVAQSACEGFCSEGNSPCTEDADCAGLGEGTCQGREPVGHPNVCWCECLDRDAGGPTAPGSLQCNLGVHVRLRQSDCSTSPVLVDFGEKCIALTTGAISADVVHSNDGISTSIGPITNAGTPISCNALQTGVTSSISLAGNAVYFDTPIGDAIARMSLECD